MSDPLISIELRAHIASLTAERDALLAAKERAEGERDELAHYIREREATARASAFAEAAKTLDDMKADEMLRLGMMKAAGVRTDISEAVAATLDAATRAIRNLEDHGEKA